MTEKNEVKQIVNKYNKSIIQLLEFESIKEAKGISGAGLIVTHQYITLR